MNWWASLYDDWLAEQLLVREEADETLDFLIGRLDLVPGMRVMDQGCGVATLSLPLAEKGFRVLGIDQASSYIARANRDARARGLELELVVGNACQFVPEEPVDAAFNWWTSFGYAETDVENVAMLQRAFDALVPKGASPSTR